MDLAYLRAHPQQLPTLLAHQRIRETPVPGGSICSASRLTLDDGSSIFLKSWPDGSTQACPAGFFQAEAAGLELLREPAAVPVPEVISVQPDLLALEWIEPGRPTAETAAAFGRGLAQLHAATLPDFGTNRTDSTTEDPSVSRPVPGYIGSMPLDPTCSGATWPDWFAACRLAPYLRLSVDREALQPADARVVEAVLSQIARYAGPDEPPARIHGDLWPGNVLWADRAAYLIDPAAHGGHRETDLATLRLFGGAPFLDEILEGYQQVSPLAAGWTGRIPLHQLHLLLVHTATFGAAYRPAVLSAARATVEQ